MTPTFYFLGVWKSACTWSQHYHTLDGDGDGNTILYSTGYHFYCQCIIVGRGFPYNWTIRTGENQRIWKVRTSKAVYELCPKATFPNSKSHSCSTVIQFFAVKAYLKLVWVQLKFKRTLYVLWRVLIYRGTQVVKQGMSLIIWMETSWPELHQEGEAYIHIPWFLPLYLL